MLKLIFLLTFFLTIYPFADFNNMVLFLPSFYILTLAFTVKFYRSLSLSFFSFYCFIFHHVMFPFNLYPINSLLQLLSKPQSVFRTSGSNNSKGWLVSVIGWPQIYHLSQTKVPHKKFFRLISFLLSMLPSSTLESYRIFHLSQNVNHIPPRIIVTS